MKIGTAAAAAAGVVGTVVGLPALYLSKRLHKSGLDPAENRKPDPLDLEVTALSATSVSLRRLSKKADPRPGEAGEFLLQGARGWGFAGPLRSENGVTFVREFRAGGGDLRIGDAVRLDSFAFPHDPLAAHGIAFDHVTFESPLGEFPAWHVPGRADTWAILTHGKGATRRETLRVLPVLHGLAVPAVAITYRNDEGCPPSPNGMYAYGHGEWEEVEGAARWALSNGAKRLLLVGYSMGGATTVSFMGKSELAKHVSGLLLDAPMLDLETTVEHGARRLGLPIWFLAISNRVTARRYGFRWRDFDHRGVTKELDVPVLLFHGDDDRTVPVSTSDDFARARPDIVEYHRPEGVDHVRAWNADPERYEAALRSFAERMLRG